MALINMDWSKELDQIHSVIKNVLEEDISPFVDQKIMLINKQADELMRKSAFQADFLVKEVLTDISKQRKILMSEITKLILILFTSITISGAILIWVYFTLSRYYS